MYKVEVEKEFSPEWMPRGEFTDIVGAIKEAEHQRDYLHKVTRIVDETGMVIWPEPEPTVTPELKEALLKHWGLRRSLHNVLSKLGLPQPNMTYAQLAALSDDDIAGLFYNTITNWQGYAAFLRSCALSGEKPDETYEQYVQHMAEIRAKQKNIKAN